MTAQTGATTERPSHTEESSLVSRDVTRLYQEGLIAGLIGAATVALWFLIVDSIQGRPLYTPTVLGAALFHRGAAPWLDAVPNLEMVLMFTWVHGLAFVVIGGIVARLLALAERQPNAGFGILLLFVFFEFGFIAAAMLFAALACFCFFLSPETDRRGHEGEPVSSGTPGRSAWRRRWSSPSASRGPSRAKSFPRLNDREERQGDLERPQPLPLH